MSTGPRSTHCLTQSPLKTERLTPTQRLARAYYGDHYNMKGRGSLKGNIKIAIT
jgi:hypothetical protein